MSHHAARMSIADYARREGIPPVALPLGHSVRRAAVVAWSIRVASEALSEGARLVLIGEGRALSESEAVEAIREGRVVEVVS